MRKLFPSIASSAFCLLLSGFCLLPSSFPEAQTPPCQAPAPPASKQPNFFTETQENDLGDAVAERTDRDIRIIDNDEITANLRRIGGRLVRHLPSKQLNIRFQIVDLPDANAFVLPGGRVYVSRKLIGFVQSEDELAGVIGHELGHLVARQQTLQVSKQMREVLNVTAVGDRQDIFAKYNQLMDNAARKPGAFESSSSREDGDQLQADQIGLYVVAAAGYDPQALVRFWDRFADTRGKTGNFFSNLFGGTSVDSKRLRELMKGAASIPASCIEAQSNADRTTFQQWQAEVIGYVGPARKENLTNVISRTVLEPALRAELTTLRFSPNGRLILAQDEGGITVLSREPLTPVFHIDSTEAIEPQFSPDSSSIVFHTQGLRVERWSVETKTLVEVHELFIRAGCLEARLSPDGKVMSCLDGNTDLELVDVSTGAQIHLAKKFYNGDLGLALLERLISGYRTLVNLGFSADARFFAAGFHASGFGISATRDGAFVFDLQNKTTIELKGNVRRMLADGFVFTGPDQLLVHNPDDDAKSGRVKLPAADVVEQVKLFAGGATAAAHGNFVLLRPFQKYGVGVMDLARGAVVKGNAQGALDIHDDVFVAERTTGELGLYKMDGNSVVSVTALPRARLGSIGGAGISPDLKWLAVSGTKRGAVWDLANGTRVLHVPGFNGGFFDDRNQLFADFPKTSEDKRRLGRLDPSRREFARVVDLVDAHVDQAGPVLLARALTPNKQGIVLEARDVHDGRPVWTKTFAAEPPVVVPSDRSGTVILAWDASSKIARDEAKKNPTLTKQLSALRNTKGDMFLQVLDVRTGTSTGAIFIETGNSSFDIRDAVAVGDWLALEDLGNRVLLYSLSTGEQKGHVFGGRAVIAPGESGLLKVSNGDGRVAIYDLATMDRRHDLTFTHDVAVTRFSPDGTKLLVVTADQTAYLIDLKK